MRRVTLRDFEDLDPRVFQDLVAALVIGEHSKAEQLSGADGGADVLLERRDGPPRAWQVKHFPRRIQWPQCEKSLDDVVANYGVDEVVFVFPRDMSRTLKKSFEKRLGSRHPGVAVSYVSGSQLIDRLRRREDLVEKHFGLDPRDQARAVAEHLAARGVQVAGRPESDEIFGQLELADAAGRRDRYYRTEVAITTGDAPIPAWEEGPAFVLTREARDRTLRIAAWPEGSGPTASLDLHFPEGEEGRRARWEVRRTLAMDGKVKVPAAVRVTLDAMPEAMQALSDSKEIENAEIIPTETHPIRLVAEHEGERVERTMDTVRVPAREAGDTRTYDYGRIDGSLGLFVSFRIEDDGLHTHVELDLEANGMPDLRDALDAARLLVGVDQGTGMLEARTLAPIGSVEIRAVENENRFLEHRSQVRLFEDLLAIQDALGATFELGEMVTAEQAEAVHLVANVLRSGNGCYSLVDLSGDIPAEDADLLCTFEEKPAVARFPVAAEVFGQMLDLGIAEAEMPKPDSVQASKMPDAPSRLRVELSWDSEPTVSFKLISRPGEPRPKTGTWPIGFAPPLDAS